MPKMDKLSGYMTTIGQQDGKTVVTYQATAIVSWDDKTITLNHGGWKTVTTKRKMVQAANQFNLGYGIRQKDYEWFVITDKGEFKIEGRKVIIDRATGNVTQA